VNKMFSKEELELLAHGFGFFVQESPFEDDLAHELLRKLYRLIDEASDMRLE
jgi:hypothetical protein